MSIVSILARGAEDVYTYDSGYRTTYYADGSSAASGLFVLMAFLFIIGGYVISALCLMGIFKKAGVAQWAAWVPFYNNWKLLEIGGQQGFWAVLALIPFVNIVSAIFMFIAQYHIGKKLGKSGAFLLWAIFIPIVWFVWLAVDKSKWNDAASSAPSLHHN